METYLIRTSGLVLAAGLLLASCTPNAPVSGPPYEVSAQTNVSYGPLPAERGDLYVPKGLTNPPVVLVIHGGGWMNEDRTASTGLARLLAQRGLAALNIDYRLANPTSPNTRWPAQLVDAQLAVRWLRANAGALHVNTARMGAIGDSAGAQMALMLGVLPGVVPGDQAGLYAAQRPNVSAVADLFGPVDVASLPPWVQGEYPALFGTATPTPELLASMSPLPHINSDAAPVLIVQGTADVVVPMAQSILLTETLRRQGVKTEMVQYAGGHGFEGLDGNAIYALQQRAVAWLAAQLQH
jgi:acetyl esterase/lipase